MEVEKLEVEEFLNLSAKHPIIDVRSPAEFEHAHIPNAYSLPLFDNEERKIIGTLYKQESKETAIKQGLDFFGPKMKIMVEEVEKLITNLSPSKTILVHCWRGGMRSGAVAWLLKFYGFNVKTLNGGYKTYRNWVLSSFEHPIHLRILSGYTGSGKTKILHELANLGEAILDLEELAHHRGSAFGALGLSAQPSNEQFENELAMELKRIRDNFQENCPIWVESESSRIGNINIHHLFFNQMKNAERIHIEVPIDKRVENIMEQYGHFEKNKLIEAVERIHKRLGGLNTQLVISLIQQNEIARAFRILLEKYYDKLYDNSTYFQPAFLNTNLPIGNFKKEAQFILNQIDNGK